MTTPSRPHRLSKSRFVAGVQCHKLVWWRVHEPNAEELQPDIVRFVSGKLSPKQHEKTRYDL
ncbi:MAG: hypothetical protein O6933_06425, partial [Planctomycetota bacterium]|nr:hypothetical protein [Planctomycetota bacterium]